MSDNITEESVLAELRKYHNSPFTVELVAEGMGIDRQSIAPYFPNLVSDGILVELMKTSFSHINTLRNAGHPVITYGFTCFALSSKYSDLISPTYEIAFQALLKRMGHESIIPSGISFGSGWYAAVMYKFIPWIVDGFECEVCSFLSNTYINWKTGGRAKKVAKYFLIIKKEGIDFRAFGNHNYNCREKIEEGSN